MSISLPTSLKHTLFAFALCIVAIPLSREISPHAMIDGDEVYLAWLPISAMIAIMLLFGRYAVIPIIFASFIVNIIEWPLNAVQSIVLVTCQTLPVILFSGVVRLLLGKRWRYGLPNIYMGVRIFWLGFVAPVMIKVLMYIAGKYLVFPPQLSSYFLIDSINYSIIDTMSLIAGSLMFSMFFYYPLRVILHPCYAIVLWRTCVVPCMVPSRRAYTLGWLAVLCGLLILLCSPYESALINGYLVPTIFVVFTVGIRKLAHRFITLSWAMAAYLLLKYNDGFLHGLNTEYSLAFVLSVFISFSLCILYMSMIFRKSEWVKRVWREQALTDPLTGLPNLRALEQYVQQSPETHFCCLSMNNLVFLSRHYGAMMGVHVKRTISREIEKMLNSGERIFQLPGNELMINLNGPDPEQRLTYIVNLLNSRKVNWHNTVLDIEFSASWGVMEPDISGMQTMLGQLSYLAELAASSRQVLSLNSSREVVTGETSERIFMLQKVKRALESGGVMLFIQPIVDADGSGYHEILTRLNCDGETIMPDKFIPIVAQFNLSARFDMQVLETILHWLEMHPDEKYAPRFSVNLMPYTLMQKEMAQHIIALFQQYDVSTKDIIIEITEEQAFSDSEISICNINMLREAGFKIAIDDFGTGYANYERLKSLQVDIIKIDGCFINDILTDSMNAMIVKSICQMANVKSLCVVAEFVETAEQRELLLQLGVHYLQGYLFGKPEPIACLNGMKALH